MFPAAWKMLRDTVLAFINDEALSRGAAMACLEAEHMQDLLQAGRDPELALTLDRKLMLALLSRPCPNIIARAAAKSE
jgi:hypothetical protein